MGCNECDECGQKFESYDADEYADGEDSEGEPLQADYETYPDCPGKQEEARANNDELESLREEAHAKDAELKLLRAQVVKLQKQTSVKRAVENTVVLSVDVPVAKVVKVLPVASAVWEVAMGDNPGHNKRLIGVKVLGAYFNERKAVDAMTQFMKDEDRNSKGRKAERMIEIFRSTVDQCSCRNFE
ncbi:hypothetical protein T492DRAFT_847393 [Pavlovales sp. CCMP2436]|nr:hypothetical protein T492DRAFT_847393 [Pavlovales sp. CCMP2436]